MHMCRLFGTLVLGNCASRTPGFVFVQLRGVTALGSSVTRRILREPPFGAATGTAALPSNLASFPSSVRIGAGGVLALALLSSSSRFSSEAASPVGWARHGGGSLQTHRTPSMAIASVPGTGAGGDALVQKGVSSSMMSTEDKLPVIFVLGGPGSGKGTQCEMLAKEYGYIHLSAGELLRRERESGSSDGQLIDEYIREGRIVPVAITMALLKKAMQTSAPRSRFLIDGFPRNDDNRQGWEATMTDLSDVRCVLFLHCPEEVLEQRLLSRGKNSGRTDDNAEAAKKRFRTYVETTLPVVEEYEREGLVTRVNGNQDIHNVFQDVISGLRPVQEKELLDAHRAATAAASSGDWEAYADMCTPDVTELIGGGLSAAKTWGDPGKASSPSRPRARMLNGGAGIISCERALPGESGLLPMLQETTVWEMSEGRWKCTHRHASPRSL